jgi:hypothetical protein
LTDIEDLSVRKNSGRKNLDNVEPGAQEEEEK